MNRGSERFHTLYPFAYRLPRSVFVNLGLDAFAYRLPRDESVFFTYPPSSPSFSYDVHYTSYLVSTTCTLALPVLEAVSTTCT